MTRPAAGAGLFLLTALTTSWGGASDAAVTAAAASSGTIHLTVTNPVDASRQAETVEVRAAVLAPRLSPRDLAGLCVTDLAGGHELLAQAVDENGDGTDDVLVFQADFAPRQARRFALTRCTPRPPRREDFRVYGRFVRERHDDFAWENDRVAFRVYGPALETFAGEPLTSSAVDVWSKRTRRLVIDDWYLVDDYHHDHGEGGDFYPAGRSRGCGGSGLIVDGALAVSRNFRDSRVLARGPIRLVFELTYPLWQDGLEAAETKLVSLDAGSHFNRFESRYRLPPSRPADWAAGVRKAEGAQLRIEKTRGFVRTWERQDRYGDGGWLGCAVVVDQARLADVVERDGNVLAVGGLAASGPAVWYAGAGWDRSGDVPDVEAWDREVEAFARRLASPLKIEVEP